MDLASDIINKLKNKDYDDFTKIRYIYLYLCNIFSYDSRFYNKNNPKLRHNIYYKEVDIHNVQEYEIVCYTFSKIIKDVLALFGYESKIIIEDTQSTYAHTHVEVMVKGYRLKLDPSKYYDTARVKLRLMTYGFIDMDNSNEIYDDILEADRIIYGYKNKFFSYDSYQKTALKDIKRTFLRVLRMYENDPVKKISSAKAFKMKVKELFKTASCRYDLTRHNDINYYISYLVGIYELKEKDSFINGSIFFKKDNPNEIIDIFYAKHKNLVETFYVLKKDGKHYHAKEVGPDIILDLLEEYEGLNDFYCQELATKLLNKNKGRQK